MAEEIKTSEIIRTYREQLGNALGRSIRQEEFGEKLTEGMTNTGITRQTIGNWENGRTAPEIEFLMALYTYHFGTETWQLRFAVDCLMSLRPQTFQSGIITLAQPK